MTKDNPLIEIKQIQEYKDLKKLVDVNEPNMFRILGQSHTERWHSAFWSWLFDVNGSHRLKEESPLLYLFEYLFQLSDENKKPRINRPVLPVKLDIKKITTKPNEKDNKEETCDNSRFDTFIDGKDTFTCIIEYKVEANFDIKQLEKYYQISKKYQWKNPIFIYVVPETRYDEFMDFYNDLKDEYKVWYCLSFQDLYKGVIKRLIPQLSKNTMRNKLLIADYAQNMFVNKKGIKLAFGDNELDFSMTINEKYRDLLDELKRLYEKDYSNLSPEKFLGDEYDTIMSISNALVYKGQEKLFRSAPVVKLNDITIDEKYYYQVLIKVIDYFEEKGLLDKLPKLKKDGHWSYSNDSKTKRDTIKTSKDDMDVPKQSKTGKYYIETKYGKTAIQQIINSLIKELKQYTDIQIKYVLW